jgi:hypothetical protein
MLAQELELESELERAAEQMLQGDELDVLGISGTDNRWFASAGQARKAALRRASQLGPGHRIAHDANPARGQPHYHVIDSTGRRVSGHFFYGRKPPRRLFRGRPWREFEQQLEAGYRDIATATGGRRRLVLRAARAGYNHARQGPWVAVAETFELAEPEDGEQMFSWLKRRARDLAMAVSVLAAPVGQTAVDVAAGRWDKVPADVHNVIKTVERLPGVQRRKRYRPEASERKPTASGSPPEREMESYGMHSARRLMAQLALAAARSPRSAEAELFSGLAAPLVAAAVPRLAPVVAPILPQFGYGLAGVARALHAHASTRPLLRKIPQVALKAARSLAPHAAASVIAPEKVATTLARATLRTLG